MSHALILGPSSWRRGLPRPPLRGFAPRNGSRGARESLPTPLEIRRALAAALASGGCNASLFEDWPKQPGGSYTRSFRECLRSLRVDQFFLIWPKGASLLGVDWELGILAERIEGGRLDPSRIVLFLETGVGRVDLRLGLLSIGEPGNRTRYFEDLLRWGCPFSFWSTYAELLDRAWQRASQMNTSNPEPQSYADIGQRRRTEKRISSGKVLRESGSR
jgi:hypothetical protein